MKTGQFSKLKIGMIISAIFSIAAIVISIIALSNICPRQYQEDNPGLDYLGVIIGILALLVTFLVAWQIWQTMASRDEIKTLTKLNKDLENSLERMSEKIYKDINEHVELRNKNTLEIVKTIQEDYESSTEALVNFILIRDSQPSYMMLKHAIKVFRRFNNPDNLKARTALEVLGTFADEVLKEPENYQALVNEIPYEDICWLYSYDYGKNDCYKHIGNIEKYKARLRQIMALYPI